MRPQLSLRGHTFFCLARKKYAKKRRRGREIALTRRKTGRYILRVVVAPSVVRTPLRATVKSGFLSARGMMRIVPCAPVEYECILWRYALRLSYVKYLPQCDISVYEIECAARRAFLDGLGNENTHNRTTRLFARQRYFASPAPLFCILFSGKTEKSMPSETQLRCRRKNGTLVNTKGGSAPPARSGGQSRPPLQDV